MIAVTRDPAWESRLRSLAARRGWPCEFRAELSGLIEASSRRILVVADASLLDRKYSRAVAGLRARLPEVLVILALAEEEMSPDSLRNAMASGADEVIGKEWSDKRLSNILSAFFDGELAAEIKTSSDGGLRADRRSHRAHARLRGRWTDLELHPAEFSLLWRLLEREGQAVSREELLEALKSALGRDFEAETVARRVLSLRRALSVWRGRLESVRGGFYRLVRAGKID